MSQGVLHPKEVCEISHDLEVSPSKSQTTSSLIGTKGNVNHGTAHAKGGSGGGTKHKKGSKLGKAMSM